MSKKYLPYHPDQRMLFPPTIEEFVPSNHPSHFVRRVVTEQLRLDEILAEYDEIRGAPPFDPKMMTGLLLYSYMRGEYSSRRIAQACIERVDFMAVTAMNRPDFRTIAKFRVRHMAALEGLFVQVVELCGEAKLFDLKHVATDGTKLKGNASWSKNKSYKGLKEEERAIKASIEEWFKKAQAADAEEDVEYGEDDDGNGGMPSLEESLQRVKEAQVRLEEREKERQRYRETLKSEGIHPGVKERNCPRDEERDNSTDPDSRLISAVGGYIQGYNGQVAVDSKRQIIVTCHVSSTGNDKQELEKTVPKIKSNCGAQAQEISADSDYLTERNLRILKEHKIRGYVAVGKGKRDPTISAKPLAPDSLREQMRQRLRQAGKRTRYRLRKITVEPVFGMIKATRRFRGFMLRGIQKVNAEWALVCTAHNLWKLKTWAA